MKVKEAVIDREACWGGLVLWLSFDPKHGQHNCLEKLCSGRAKPALSSMQYGLDESG